MTAILRWRSQTDSGQCDARCYDAKDHKQSCGCICGGANHGAGKHQATIRTRAKAVDWMAAHPDITWWTVAKGIPFRQPNWGISDPRYEPSLSKHERYWKAYPGYKGNQHG